MNIATPSTLLFAAIVDSPAIYAAFHGDMDPSTALMRYFIALVVCGAMLALLRSLTGGYAEERKRVEDAARAEKAKREAAEREAAEAGADADSGDPDYDGPERRRANA